MTEKQKRDQGLMYNANYDQEIINELTRCKDLCFEYNHIRPSEHEKRIQFLMQLFGRANCILATT